MAGNKFLQGQLNQPITRPAYHGVKSDSLEVVVNNSDMTITGNVIWDAFIGTTLGKAYSGVDGKRNYEAILKLTAELNDTIEQFVNYKSTTNTRLSAVENVAADVDTTISSKLSDEITRSLTKDKELLDKIIQESQRALAAEASFVHDLEIEALLRSNVDEELRAEIQLLSSSAFDKILELSKKIDSVNGVVSSTETQLIEKINNETLRAVLAEQELRSAIEATNITVAQFRAQVETAQSNTKETFQNELDILSSLIETETSRATKTENELKERIDNIDYNLVENIQKSLVTEIQARENADVDLSRRLQTEIARSKNIESDVISKLQALETSQSDLKTYTSSLVEEESKARVLEVDRLDAEVASLKQTAIDTSESIVQLEASIAEIEAGNTVATQEAVEKLVNESVTVVSSEIDKVRAELLNEVSRSTDSDITLEAKLNEASVSLEQTDEELTQKIVDVQSQLDDLQNATNTSLVNTTIRLDGLEKNIQVAKETTSILESNFDLLTATDEQIEKQLKLLQMQINAEVAVNKSQDETLTTLIKSKTATDQRLTDVENESIRNRESIDNLSSKVDSIDIVTDSIQRNLERIDSEHNSRLEGNEQRLTEQAVEIITLQTDVSKLVAEDTRSDAAIEDLYKKLNAEIVDRADAIKVRSIEHGAEVRRSVEKDAEHDKLIATNTSNIVAVEDRLVEAINIKEQDSITRDDYLKEKLDIYYDVLTKNIETTDIKLNSTLQSERAERVTKDTELQTTLNELSAVVTSGNEQLSNLAQIVGEEVRTNEEFRNTTSSQLTNVTGEVTLLKVDRENYIRKAETEGEKAYVQNGSTTSFVTVTTNAEPDSIVKRSLDGNIQLPETTSNFGSADAVPRSFVESLIEDVKEVLYEEMQNFSFDIIDGGKAPIKK